MPPIFRTGTAARWSWPCCLGCSRSAAKFTLDGGYQGGNPSRSQAGYQSGQRQDRQTRRRRQRLPGASKTLGGRADVRVAEPLSAPRQALGMSQPPGARLSASCLRQAEGAQAGPEHDLQLDESGFSCIWINGLAGNLATAASVSIQTNRGCETMNTESRRFRVANGIIVVIATAFLAACSLSPPPPPPPPPAQPVSQPPPPAYTPPPPPAQPMQHRG
jgi:hypothetical protein